MWKINEDNVTSNPKNPLEMYIYTSEDKITHRGLDVVWSENYRKYYFMQLGHRGVHEKKNGGFDLSKDFAYEVYKEYVAIIYSPYTDYDYDRKWGKFMSDRYWTKSVTEKVIKFLKSNKWKDILWTCCNAGKKKDTVVVFAEHLDRLFFDRLCNCSCGNGSGILFRRYKHYCLQHNGDINETAKSYLYEKEFLFEITLRKNGAHCGVIVNNDYIPYEKFLKLVEPILKKHEFVLANRVDPYPPDCTGLSEEETAQRMKEWEEAREELTIYNRATLNILKEEERYKQEQQEKRKKAEEKRLEDERIIKEKLERGESLDPYEQAGRNIVNWIDSFGKK